MTMHPTSLDFYIQRMAQLPALRIPEVRPNDKSNGEHVVQGMSFPGEALARELAIDEAALGRDVAAISVQVAYWGRIAAQARRAWQFSERVYRSWRDSVILEACKPQGADWKKPTEKQLEALYRTQPGYQQHQAMIETAEEAYNGAQAMFEGLRTKKDMLKTAVIRTNEDSAPRLAI